MGAACELRVWRIADSDLDATGPVPLGPNPPNTGRDPSLDFGVCNEPALMDGSDSRAEQAPSPRGMRAFGAVAFGALVIFGVQSALVSLRDQLLGGAYVFEAARVILLVDFALAVALFGVIEYLVLARPPGRDSLLYQVMDTSAALLTGAGFSFLGGVLQNLTLAAWGSFYILVVTVIWTLTIALRLRRSKSGDAPRERGRARDLLLASLGALALLSLHMFVTPLPDLWFPIALLAALILGAIVVFRDWPWSAWISEEHEPSGPSSAQTAVSPSSPPH